MGRCWSWVPPGSRLSRVIAVIAVVAVGAVTAGVGSAEVFSGQAPTIGVGGNPVGDSVGPATHVDGTVSLVRLSP